MIRGTSNFIPVRSEMKELAMIISNYNLYNLSKYNITFNYNLSYSTNAGHFLKWQGTRAVWTEMEIIC